MKRLFSDFFRDDYLGYEGKKLLTENASSLNSEELNAALLNEELGTIEKNENNEVTLKFPESKAKEIEALGITSVELRGPNGIQTFSTFNVQALNDKELDLLIINVKVYIISLKVLGDQNDEKNKKKIEHQELKLKYCELEKAIRLDDRDKIKNLMNEIIKQDVFKTAIKISDIILKSIIEKREEEKEREFWKTKQIIIFTEIMKWELHLNIIKEEVQKNDINSNNVLNGVIFQKNKTKMIINLGRFMQYLHKD